MFKHVQKREGSDHIKDCYIKKLSSFFFSHNVRKNKKSGLQRDKPKATKLQGYKATRFQYS